MRLKKAFEVRGNLELKQNNRIVSNLLNLFSPTLFSFKLSPLHLS